MNRGSKFELHLDIVNILPTQGYTYLRLGTYLMCPPTYLPTQVIHLPTQIVNQLSYLGCINSLSINLPTQVYSLPTQAPNLPTYLPTYLGQLVSQVTNLFTQVKQAIPSCLHKLERSPNYYVDQFGYPMGPRAFWWKVLKNEANGHPTKEIPIRSRRDHQTKAQYSQRPSLNLSPWQVLS